MRPPVLVAVALLALSLAACGSEGVSVPAGDSSAAAGAEIFAANCAGCHTMGPAGSQGSGVRDLRAQGPNLDQRLESYDEALYAIRNGGFSGAIMPQNIVVGDDAALVAEFVAKYAGTEIDESPRPAPAIGTETGEDVAAPDSVETEPSDSGSGPAPSGSGGSGPAPGGSGGSGSATGAAGSGSAAAPAPASSAN